MYGRIISRTGIGVRAAARAVRHVSVEFNNVRGVRVSFVVYRKEVGDGAVCTGTVPYRTGTAAERYGISPGDVWINEHCVCLCSVLCL